jgi:hypothetical protein
VEDDFLANMDSSYPTVVSFMRSVCNQPPKVAMWSFVIQVGLGMVWVEMAFLVRAMLWI